jgi:hypothetical protein
MKSRLALVVLGALAATSCDEFAHKLRSGRLSEVQRPSITLSVWEHQPMIMIGNEARDGACLELHDLTLRIDGVPQTLTSLGSRESGQHKGDFGPVRRTDYCSGARASVVVPSDPARTADAIEVSDGTLALRAEFPNLFAKSVWSKPPPASARRGGTFRVAIAPEPPKGTGGNDASNYVLATLFNDKLGPKIDLGVRAVSGSEFDLTVPAATLVGSYRLILASVQGQVEPKLCTASSCVASSELVLEAPIDVSP